MFAGIFAIIAASRNRAWLITCWVFAMLGMWASFAGALFDGYNTIWFRSILGCAQLDGTTAIKNFGDVIYNEMANTCLINSAQQTDTCYCIQKTYCFDDKCGARPKSCIRILPRVKTCGEIMNLEEAILAASTSFSVLSMILCCIMVVVSCSMIWIPHTSIFQPAFANEETGIEMEN